ncbi:MAG: type II secretion system secretin GspD [Gammaproteobacteria bacterium]|nr:type II secretion system secretin GspD [Gammaproteobacteria bacterium]
MISKRPRLWPALVLALALSPALAAEKVTLNLKDADIRALIDTVAEITGKNFVVDPRVKGQVTVISTEPIDSAAVYEVFRSILQVHGFAAIESGAVIKVVPDTTAKQLDTPVGAGVGREAVVTHVIPIDHVAAAQLVPILRPLVPQQGHLAAYPPSNVLIVSDRAGNVQRLARIVERIDRETGDELEVVPLNHASASEVVRILGNLVQRQGADAAAGLGPRLAADERTNSVLMRGDRGDRLRLRAIISHLDTPLEKGGNTHVVYLRYAKAEDMVPVLEGLSTSITSARQGQAAEGAQGGAAVSIQADESTNALVINAPPGVYRSLRSVIKQLDIRRAQVLVEAIIADMSADRAAQLGLQWASDGTAGDNEGALGLQAFGGAGNNIVQLFLEPVSVGEGLTVGVGEFADGEFRLGALVRALASDASTNILSTPSLVTLDNTEAEIVVAQNVPFITGQFTTQASATTEAGTVNPFQTIERQDVGLTLRVTPQINEGDAVKLDIVQEVSSLAPAATAGAADLITNKRSIKTSVLVEDGRFVVLGGLIDDSLQERVQKVPFLGDVPVLRHLFRFSDTTKVKRNLMVFLHPVILRDPLLATRVSSEKYNYMRAQQLAQRRKGVNLMPDEQAPLMPERESLLRLPPPFEEEAGPND